MIPHYRCNRCGAVFPCSESMSIDLTLEDDDGPQDNKALALFRDCPHCGTKIETHAEKFGFVASTYCPPNEKLMEKFNISKHPMWWMGLLDNS